MNRKKLYGWNRTMQSLSHVISSKESIPSSAVAIPRGAGLSYGDAALNQLHFVISDQCPSSDFEFNPDDKSLTAPASATIFQTIEYLKSFNQCLSVMPGTSRATLGGCIASNVHGKNHHILGSFSEQVLGFWLQLTPGGAETYCSDGLNSDLFLSTFGANGLTGNITRVKLITSKRPTHVELVTTNFESLEEMFEKLSVAKASTASCLSLINWSKGSLGSGKLMQYKNVYSPSESLKSPRFSNYLPISFPFVNPMTIKLYNQLTFRGQNKPSQKHPYAMWFMADAHKNANLWFGRKGFIEYQFNLPWQKQTEAIAIMRDFAENFTIYLSGVKLMSKKSKGIIDFSIDGFTATLTTTPSTKLLKKLSEYDNMIASHGGKVYLAKDNRLDAQNFKLMYPDIEKLQRVRELHQLSKFSSNLSRRLEI